MSPIRHKLKLVLFFMGLTIPLFFALWVISGDSSPFKVNLGDLIRKELVRVDPLPTKMVDAIYMLGGSQGSLEFKFKSVADFYHKGISRKIMILSRPGKTEYSSLLGRNLSNDEWAIWKLEELGIPKKSVESISIQKGFFGTLTEAKGISKIAKNRGYKSMLLISSSDHTHRVRISFKKFLKDNNIKMCIQGSGKRASLGELLLELVKLKVYEFFLVT